ncbi:phospholipase D-like domain-containing protein [Mycoplasmopsis sturni]|uniref:phospholipase D-like domain-containing protein n=1 Tax=Mycoplasmopsis sturni TaxID=39047 RepID=UPI00068F82E8|nr:phosphatidylserine/phosphatidylglycerophosphate/cardiolipin synthase family protein [Mycoplasmopsis sturni]
MFIGLYIHNFIVVIILYAQNRNDHKKLQWLFLVIILPIIGHIIFLTFGLIYKNKLANKLDEDHKYKLDFYEQKGIVKSSERASKVINQLAHIEGNNYYPADIKFFQEGHYYYEDLFEQIQQARESIFIVSYIVRKSEIFDHLYSLLKQKLEEGVKVKWIIDDFGGTTWAKGRIRGLKKFGLEYSILGKIYYPFINAKSFSRNHQKIFIIDSKIVYTGGSNISDEYISLSPQFGHWIDLNYRLVGPIVNRYTLNFLKTWHVVTKKEVPKIEKYLFFDFYYDLNNFENDVISVFDTPNTPHSEAELYWIKLFGSAQDTIEIVTPYFSITESLKNSIIVALKSGVNITIYFSGLPDKKIVHSISLSQLKELQVYGLNIRICSDVFVHSKIGLVDGKIAWTGSNNMDSRSMFSQYESMDIFSGTSIKYIRQIIDQYHKISIDINDHPTYSQEPSKVTKFFYDWAKPII